MLIEECWACVCGLHDECYSPIYIDEELSTDQTCCCTISVEEDAKEFVRGVGRPTLTPGDVTDITSTGRKRAAMLAPIFDGMTCEWAGLKYAGGGIQPIVGCEGTTITDKKGSGERHHGPDKNVLNNSVGVNLHRICQSCHKRWHALNDPHYGKRSDNAEDPFVPEGEFYQHDPNTLASDVDIEMSKSYWATRTEKRGDYPIALPENVVS